jgi:hypothetical protein
LVGIKGKMSGKLLKETNLEDYQESLEMNLSKDEKENELQVIEHADTDPKEVEEVMAIQRETIPMLYEFSDPKVTPFSASIEEYQKDKQAYVVFSYDKPEIKLGPGSRLVYTRIYPRGSYLRKSGEFERPLGEELETLNKNGIQWSVFKIRGTSDVHLKGESGNYIFEISTHDVSIEETKRLISGFQKIN